MIGATQDGWLLGWDRIPGRDSGTWAPDNEDAPKIVAHTTEGYTIGDAVNAFHANNVSLAHEATVSKVSDDQLFYLMSRGMGEDEAMAMIVRGFIEPIARELPMEYALELNRLIELQMEGAVG